jgi:Flp pilus assembly pilin Flp
MQRRAWASRREAGASAVEYAAAFALVAILVVAVAWAARLTPMGTVMSEAVCRVSAAVGIGVCADGPGEDGGEQTDPEDVDIPSSLDPDSELVQQLLSTERGRQTLQWLFDNNIPIVIDPSATGAYWNGTEMVLGQGYANAAVLIHETNHAQATVNGESADANSQSRSDYVTTAVNEEVDGTVEQIQAAQELRIAGYTIAQQPAEAAYTTAYNQAIQNGQTRAQAERAGWDAVRGEFYNGNIVTSTTGDPYPDYYGDYWDSVH